MGEELSVRYASFIENGFCKNIIYNKSTQQPTVFNRFIKHHQMFLFADSKERC